MSDMFEYLAWRGDIPFTQVPPTPVDALIFSALVYIDFEGIVPADMSYPVPLPVAAEAFFALEDQERRIRVKNDLRLLRQAAATVRFGNVRLAFYRNLLIPEEETQFAALSFLLDDGSAFLAYRGTDMSLVGWKEDFNMSFQTAVPAQREALRYLLEFSESSPVILHLGGHSKGGNLAVYAAANSPAHIQQRITAVYNNDGPGFTEFAMDAAGIRAIVPKIRTYVPQSSVIGILLEHEEPFTIIKSRTVSLLQHEPYSWEVRGGGFVTVENLSAETRLFNETIKNWLSDMSRVERSRFVDAIYELLTASGATRVEDLIQPKNVLAFFRTLGTDDATRRLLTAEFIEFLRAAGETLLSRDTPNG